MSAVTDYLVDLIFSVSSGKNVILLTHFFIAEFRLKKTAACSTAEILTDHRIKMIAGESLLSKQYSGACSFLNAFQYLKIVFKNGFVDNITWSIKHILVEHFITSLKNMPY